MKSLFLHAPNVHVGGGGVLVRALLAAPNLCRVTANLDARLESVVVPKDAKCFYVRPTLIERARAEWRLCRLSREGDLVLCFHGLPPIFPLRGHVVVFKQNRLHLDAGELTMFSPRTRLRLRLERLICKIFRNRVDEYVVQTPTMKLAVKNWHGGDPVVRVAPFLPAPLDVMQSERDGDGGFVYVADGEAHKNHRVLIAAWTLLAADGIYVPLSLTLPPRSDALWFEIKETALRHGLRIVNLGSLSHEATLACYRSARALIFPSLAESFGLPLLEATAAGLPILAGELDYVRDVCCPAQTFDPHSARSIAAAVKRFLNVEQETVRIRTAAQFFDEIAD